MYKKGTVVLVPFPFTDLSGSKVRPAVIISNGKIGSDVIVLFVTSKLKNKKLPTITVAPDTDNGIKTQSHVVCSKLATLEAKIILGELGTLSSNTLGQIDTELKKVLAIS